MRISFTIRGHEYEGPECTGSAGLKLDQDVCAFLISKGMEKFALLELEGGEALDLLHLIPVAKHIRATAPASIRRLIEDTLKGWSCDGEPVTFASLVDVYATRERRGEWATAMANIWRENGFFTGPELVKPEEMAATS